MKTQIELRIVNWQQLRKQQRRWQLMHHIVFLRRWLASTKEIIL